MKRSYSDKRIAAKYKLPGHGNRTISALMDSLAGVDPLIDADTYGSGNIINDFEDEVAKLLGKEKAVFLPSGTMAQQIALRIWSDEKELRKVAYHPLCHLEIHEKDGLKILHGLEPVLLGESIRLFTMQDLQAINEPLACLLIELPQREIGGQLPEWNELVALSQYCRAKNLRLHLDGARVFEVLPYYNKPINEVCGLFDSVYISFYKGIGGIAGAILAGSKEYIEQAKVWKRRHGGDLISLYPYILSAKHSMSKRLNKMEEYWRHAQYTAMQLNKISGIRTIPEMPVCNMFHAFFSAPREIVEDILAAIIDKYDLALVNSLKELDPHSCMAELSFGDSFALIPKELLTEALAELDEAFNNLCKQ